jgi:ABC-type antimicrobial peptide transport system, permease component
MDVSPRRRERRCNRRPAAGFRDVAHRRRRGFADCVQQRCEPFARSLHRTTPRNRDANGARWRSPQCRAALCARKHDISVIAGVIGLLLALWVIEIVPKIAGDNVPLEGGITLHLPVLLFTLGLSLVTGLVMGVYPAWQSSRGDLVEGLKESGRSVSGSRGQHRFRRGLVSAQVALSMILLAAAAMLVSSFIRLSNQATGFRSDHVWAGAIGLPAARYPDSSARGNFVQRLLDALKTAPGVENVATTEQCR